MKKILLLIVTAFSFLGSKAQLTAPADGNSVRQTVSERVGITDVSINYGRPAVRGREGKVWGVLAHEGFKNLGFGNGKDSPWRAGANENTTIQFSTDVMIEGKKLAAGKYGFFIAYGKNMCTLIFSKATKSWGSYFYDPAEDVLRVNVKPVALTESRERLTYQFGNQTDSTAVVSLEWEKLAIPFTVSTKLYELQLASYESELRGEVGFDPHSLVQVASFMAEHNRLDDALTYANRAAQGMPTFSVYMVKADILEKMGKQPQADSMKKAAMARGTASEVHNYARGLLREGKKKEGYDAFQQNFKNYPNTYTTCVGMARGCSANGKLKDAIKYANMALPLAPDAANKKAVEGMIVTLKEGKEITPL